MSVDISVLWNYDSTTVLLLSIVVLLYALCSYLQPIPLAHPILLGRQADVGKVRMPRETATYRNYGVGHGVPVSRIWLCLVLDGINVHFSCFSSLQSQGRTSLSRMTCSKRT